MGGWVGEGVGTTLFQRSASTHAGAGEKKTVNIRVVRKIHKQHERLPLVQLIAVINTCLNVVETSLEIGNTNSNRQMKEAGARRRISRLGEERESGGTDTFYQLHVCFLQG